MTYYVGSRALCLWLNVLRQTRLWAHLDEGIDDVLARVLAVVEEEDLVPGFRALGSGFGNPRPRALLLLLETLERDDATQWVWGLIVTRVSEARGKDYMPGTTCSFQSLPFFHHTHTLSLWEGVQEE